MRSEIQNQLAGMLIYVLIASIETPQCSVASPYHVFLEEHFYRTICAQGPLSESLLSIWLFVISCEPVNVEIESRNFSDLLAQRVYR